MAGCDSLSYLSLLAVKVVFGCNGSCFIVSGTLLIPGKLVFLHTPLARGFFTEEVLPEGDF